MFRTATQRPWAPASRWVIGWLRTPRVQRRWLVAGVLAAGFAWTMMFVGLSFAMVERGARHWWLMLVFGLLMPVVSMAAVHGALVGFRRVGYPRGAARVSADPSTLPAHAATTPPAPPPATAELPIEPLSQRELEVLAQLAAGRSNNEIANALYVAPGTVKAHLNHIFRKLQAVSRLQAVTHAREAGLLDGHDEK